MPEADTDGKKSRGRWTQAEDAKLRASVELHHGRNWKDIARHAFGDAKSDVQCLHRWQKVLKPGLVKGKWTKEEDAIVIAKVKEYGLKRWSLVAKHLKGRLGKQCRERWYNHLNPNIKRGAWSAKEDEIIMKYHTKLGNKWATIATYLEGRTDNSIKNRWHSTLKKRLPGYVGPPSREDRRTSAPAAQAEKKRGQPTRRRRKPKPKPAVPVAQAPQQPEAKAVAVKNLDPSQRTGLLSLLHLKYGNQKDALGAGGQSQWYAPHSHWNTPASTLPAARGSSLMLDTAAPSYKWPALLPSPSHQQPVQEKRETRESLGKYFEKTLRSLQTNLQQDVPSRSFSQPPPLIKPIPNKPKAISKHAKDNSSDGAGIQLVVERAAEDDTSSERVMFSHTPPPPPSPHNLHRLAEMTSISVNDSLALSQQMCTEASMCRLSSPSPTVGRRTPLNHGGPTAPTDPAVWNSYLQYIYSYYYQRHMDGNGEVLPNDGTYQSQFAGTVPQGAQQAHDAVGGPTMSSSTKPESKAGEQIPRPSEFGMMLKLMADHPPPPPPPAEEVRTAKKTKPTTSPSSSDVNMSSPTRPSTMLTASTATAASRKAQIGNQSTISPPDSSNTVYDDTEHEKYVGKSDSKPSRKSRQGPPSPPSDHSTDNHRKRGRPPTLSTTHNDELRFTKTKKVKFRTNNTTSDSPNTEQQ